MHHDCSERVSYTSAQHPPHVAGGSRFVGFAYNPGYSRMVERDSKGFETLSPLFMKVSISLCTLAACLAAFRLYSTFQRRGWLGMEDGMVASSSVRVETDGVLTAANETQSFLMIITVIGCEGTLTKPNSASWPC